jgi:hypothetical protein
MSSLNSQLTIVNRLYFLSSSAKWQHTKITAYSNDDDLDTRASTFLLHLFRIDDAVIAISAEL